MANLTATSFNFASLAEADLRLARFFRTELIETDLTKAKTGFTIFGEVDLSKVKGLEKVQHAATSVIDLKSIQNSRGEIPLVFLRGCGLSDLEVEVAKLVNRGLNSEQVTDITYRIHQLYIGSGIQYFSCFVSYNNKDELFAQRLYNDLQNNGVRCWYAPEDIKIGDQIRPTLDRQIRLRDKLLVILSINSIESKWVGDEVESALEEEQKNGRLVLFPIRIDNAVMDLRKDWAAKIKRRRHIGDFSNWQDQGSYQKAFERLLRDLRIESNS